MQINKIGATSQTIYVQLETTADVPATGLAFNTAGLAASYVPAAAAHVPISLQTQTPTGAWVTGGLAEVSFTNAPGLYRIDVPNAAYTVGPSAVLTITGTGLRPYHELIVLSSTVELEQITVTSVTDSNSLTVSGLSASAGQASRRLLQFLTGPCAGERVLIVAQSSGGLIQIAPPLSVVPGVGNRAVLL